MSIEYYVKVVISRIAANGRVDLVIPTVRESRCVCALGIAVLADIYPRGSLPHDEPGAVFVHKAEIRISRRGSIVDLVDFVAVGGVFDGRVDQCPRRVFYPDYTGAGITAEESRLRLLGKDGEEENGNSRRADDFEECPSVAIEILNFGNLGFFNLLPLKDFHRLLLR